MQDLTERNLLFENIRKRDSTELVKLLSRIVRTDDQQLYAFQVYHIAEEFNRSMHRLIGQYHSGGRITYMEGRELFTEPLEREWEPRPIPMDMVQQEFIDIWDKFPNSDI